MLMVPRAEVGVEAAAVPEGIDDVDDVRLEIVTAFGAGQGGADDDGLVRAAEFLALDNFELHFKLIFPILFDLEDFSGKNHVRVVEILLRRPADAGAGRDS